ncbi:MAG: hypothetical protein M1837_005838 [Sclerophora amabilis]|nr:MAG: hypothetical protein M1837_005838 [Sclerophora amabilis]
MDRRWDNPTSASTSPGHNQQTQFLPSINDLAKGVRANGHPAETPSYPTNHSVRDSGNWSMQTGSKHSSVVSSATSGLQLPSIASQRASSNGHSYAPSGERSPFGTSITNGQTSAVASDHPHSGLTQINQPFDFNQPRSTNAEFPQESRRSSIASGVGHLAIQSPLPSNNASQTSLANNLQRERGIPADSARNGGAFASAGNPRPGPLTSTPSTPLSNRRTQRTAPPINPNPRSEWPNVYADAPTKGHPYAFPDPEMSKTIGPVEEERAVSSHRSRRDSLGAASVTSSIYTSDSRLPSGQQRLDDDHSSPNDEDGSMSFYQHRSTSDLGSVAHHHHQLQHKQLSGLIGAPDSPSGATPYSRTPELRVSHKLAERKRRSEMKGLFDELRGQLPPDNRASKTSKWEILTRAIEHIKALNIAWEANQKHLEVYQEQANRTFMLQQENKELREEIARGRQQMQSGSSVSLHYHQPPPAAGPPPVSNPSNPSSSSRPTLPVPVAGQAPPSVPMQGIQYSA